MCVWLKGLQGSANLCGAWLTQVVLQPAVGCLDSSILAGSVHMSGAGWFSADPGGPRLQ